jgi:hypothetical protein
MQIATLKETDLRGNSVAEGFDAWSVLIIQNSISDTALNIAPGVVVYIVKVVLGAATTSE